MGISDDARQLKLLAFVRDYIVKPVAKSYGVPERMWQDGIVPRKYLQIRSASLPAFANHRQGAARAMDEALRGLLLNGQMMEVKRDRLVELYGFHGVAYRILDVGT